MVEDRQLDSRLGWGDEDARDVSVDNLSDERSDIFLADLVVEVCLRFRFLRRNIE